MGTITAKQLKQKTGEIIKRVKAGERLTLTHRGKPVATIAPATGEERMILEGLAPFDEAWKDIENSLEKTAPAFKGWQEAMRWVRSRT
jgi:prevent-host-death family protein